jgi:hypothetical protein
LRKALTIPVSYDHPKEPWPKTKVFGHGESRFGKRRKTVLYEGSFTTGFWPGVGSHFGVRMRFQENQ